MGLIEFFSIEERLQMLSRKLAILALRARELPCTAAPAPPPGLPEETRAGGLGDATTHADPP